jgi:ABC transport system ATP-binding/permease protein
VSHDRDFLDRLVTSTIALEGDGTAIEYAGGYSDYVIQRGPRAATATLVASRKEKAPGRESAPKARLGYKRERTLAELPGKIEALQAEIATLQQALADPDLYRRDASSFAARTARLTEAQAELESAETEWLELELLREELHG